MKALDNLVRRINAHPVIVAINEWPLSWWICRIIGHNWGWPDIVVTILQGELRFLPQWRTCRRCKLREQDTGQEAQIVIVPAFQGPPKGLTPKPDPIGEQVKRAMGWN